MARLSQLTSILILSIRLSSSKNNTNFLVWFSLRSRVVNNPYFKYQTDYYSRIYSEESEKGTLNKIQSNKQCVRFNLTAKQFKVKIDGVTYPQLVPLRDNAIKL